MSPVRDHHLSVTRTARYATLGPAGAPEVWFALHGYGQLAHRFLRDFDGVAARRLIVAPEALNRFYLDPAHQKVGASWMTREDRLTDIADYVRYLDALAAAVLSEPGARRTTVLGFSQGAATACRWVARGRTRVDRLVLWSGEVPPDLDLAEAGARLGALEVILVAGSGDTFITPKVLATMSARLTAHDIAHRTVTFTGGHVIDRETLQQLG